MAEESMYQNIQRVLQRIQTIKRRFGMMQTASIKNFQKIYDETLKKDTEIPDSVVQQKTQGSKEVSKKETIIKSASQKYQIPEALIKALIKQESNFNDTAVSKKGAQGLMQLMPDTADILGVTNPFNAEENIFGGTRYLREMINLYNGNLNKALAAYNAGPGRVKEDVPEIPETQNFVDAVLNYYRMFSNYNQGGGVQ